MKIRFLTIALLIGCVVAGAMAGKPSTLPPYEFTNIATNAATTNTYEIPVFGWLEAIKVDISGASASTTTVTVATVADKATGEAITLYSQTLTADAFVFPRIKGITTTGTGLTNQYERIPLAGDQIRVVIAQQDQTNVNAKIYIYIDE